VDPDSLFLLPCLLELFLWLSEPDISSALLRRDLPPLPRSSSQWLAHRPFSHYVQKPRQASTSLVSSLTFYIHFPVSSVCLVSWQRAELIQKPEPLVVQSQIKPTVLCSRYNNSHRSIGPVLSLYLYLFCTQFYLLLPIL
jgi:hypothetical protein